MPSAQGRRRRPTRYWTTSPISRAGSQARSDPGGMSKSARRLLRTGDRRPHRGRPEPGEQPEMSAPKVLLDGRVFVESPRWHDGRLWFSDWGTQEIVAVDVDGNSEVVARVPTTLPFCIDWVPDGRLMVFAGPPAPLLRQEPDGSLVTHADVSGVGRGFNEIVVDGRGNAYVNGVD